MSQCATVFGASAPERLARVIQQHGFGDRVKIPLEIRLWGGRTYRFGDVDRAAVKILVKDRKGLSALRRLDELCICEAYKESCDGDSRSPNFQGHLSSGCLVEAIAAVCPLRRGGDPGQLRRLASSLRRARNAWASSRRSNTWGAMPRADKVSPSLARRNALVA